ncbi:MAG: hypothetical protein OXFUSZZB_001950, partial [Candidatus Fervidibacter sp.]
AVMLTGCGGGGGGVGGIVSAQAVISGSVLDANGNPVGGAEVSTFVNDQIVRTTSGANGSFVLRFSLTSQTFVTVTARLGNQSTFAVVTVTPGTEVTVTLRFTFSGAETPPPPPF